MNSHALPNLCSVCAILTNWTCGAEAEEVLRSVGARMGVVTYVGEMLGMLDLSLQTGQEAAVEELGVGEFLRLSGAVGALSHHELLLDLRLDDVVELGLVRRVEVEVEDENVHVLEHDQLVRALDLVHAALLRLTPVRHLRPRHVRRLEELNGVLAQDADEVVLELRRRDGRPGLLEHLPASCFALVVVAPRVLTALVNLEQEAVLHKRPGGLREDHGQAVEHEDRRDARTLEPVKLLCDRLAHGERYTAHDRLVGLVDLGGEHLHPVVGIDGDAGATQLLHLLRTDQLVVEQELREDVIERHGGGGDAQRCAVGLLPAETRLFV